MSVVAVIGAGQLGRMLGEAGQALGVACRFLDPAPDPPAAAVGPVIRGAFDDPRALDELASGADVLTYEFENVPVAALSALTGGVPIRPSPTALEHAQDRAREKLLFGKLGIPVPRWRRIDDRASLDAAIDALGLPLVLKTRRFGYDGKGQAVIERPGETTTALEQFAGIPLIAEEWITYEREVSAIAARRVNGDMAVYPLTENEHRDGILRVSRAPAGPPELAALAARYLTALMHRLDYVGVLALEFFVMEGRLLANEFAPRVHNSGHWTIEGAHTSQFENHLRAVLDLPLGDPSALAQAGMVNLIGSMPGSPALLRANGMHLHDYGKTPRPRRKLGHVTLVDGDAGRRDRRVRRLDAMLST